MRSTRRDGPPSGVLERALLLLEVFEGDSTLFTLAELANRTGLPKSTVHRLVQALVTWGGLEQVNGRYGLGMRMFELGQRVQRQNRLREAALPFMEDLYEATHQIVHLGVADRHEVIYIEKLSGHRRVESPSRVGGRMPLHCTAIGKTLLAYAPETLLRELLNRPLERRTRYTIVAPNVLAEELRRIRDQGVAFDREEARLGLWCVAAPVLLHQTAVAALSVSVSMAHGTESLVPAVRTAALGIGRVLSRPHPG